MKGKKSEDGRTFDSFCNRYNVIIQELRVGVVLGSHHMFIAEVVGVQISDEYMDKTGKFNLNSTGLVAYSHGEYFALGDKLGKFGYSVRKK